MMYACRVSGAPSPNGRRFSHVPGKGVAVFEFEFSLGPLRIQFALARDVPSVERSSDVGCYLERSAESVVAGDQVPVGFRA